MTPNDLAVAVGTEAAKELSSALQRIKHCLGQLSDEQIWWRAGPALNSIGNLLLHLCGNLQQWIVCGLGGAVDQRNRAAEFAERGPLPRAELIGKLEQVVAEAKTALARMSAEEWLRPRQVQGFDVNGLGAMFDSVPHFRGHTQEIVFMTRLQLGDRYQFAWTPGPAQARTTSSERQHGHDFGERHNRSAIAARHRWRRQGCFHRRRPSQWRSSR